MSTATDQYILALDLGTSGAKAALFTAAGASVASEFEPVPILLLPNGGAEQSPADWWSAIRQASRRLLEPRAALAERVTAVCCTAQWLGTVPVDRDGNPLGNAIIWMDSRGAPYVRQITRGHIEIEGYGVDKLWAWLRVSGGLPGRSGKDSIAHILYLKHEQPGIYAAAHKFLEPKDYINLRLTGLMAASYDSIAATWVTDNRNISKIVYYDGLLRLAGITREKLPDLKRAVDILGPLRPEVAQELGLGSNVQVVMGTPDTHSAALGSGAVRDYEAHLYLGTSSWLLCHVPFKKTDLFHDMGSFPSAIPGRYLLLNEQESAGMCLTYLRDNIFYRGDELSDAVAPSDIYQRFDRIVERVPAGSDRVIFTPWLNGERTPVEDNALRACFFNQSLQTKREHLIRAVFEGVAYNTRWLLGPVESFIGRRLDAINMIGGGANSNIWCQIHADVLNRTIRQVKEPLLANARGAAFLASVALGCMRFEDILARTEIARTYQPDPANRKLYDDLFREFLNLYRSTGKIHRALNRGLAE